MSFNLTKVYDFCGGFAETVTLIALVAAICLAAKGHLEGSFAATITALGGSSILHDQFTQWQDSRRKSDAK